MNRLVADDGIIDSWAVVVKPWAWVHTFEKLMSVRRRDGSADGLELGTPGGENLLRPSLQLVLWSDVASGTGQADGVVSRTWYVYAV